MILLLTEGPLSKKEASVPNKREHQQRVIIEHKQGEEQQEAAVLACTRLSSLNVTRSLV